MNPFLGPLDNEDRVPAHQQTRVSAFLMSAHGALARQLLMALPPRLIEGWQVELHAQYCRQLEILSLLASATSWVPDPQLAFLIWQWEAAWMPRRPEGADDWRQARLIDLAAFGHALHAVTRPAALLPEHVEPLDPFAVAMRRIELEGGRLMQAQIALLKGPNLLPVRHVVSVAADWRHHQVREVWTAMLHGLNIDTSVRHLGDTAYHLALKAAAAAKRG